MGLENVTKAIIQDAQQKASSLVKQSQEEAEKLQKEAEQSFLEEDRKQEHLIRRRIQAEETRRVAQSQSEAKKALFKAKREIIDEAFAGFSSQLSKQPAAKRKVIVQSLIAKAKKQIDISVVHCNKQDFQHVNGFEKKEAEIMGGIIAENADGTERVDYSYETLLSQIRDKKLGELAGILFGK